MKTVYLRTRKQSLHLSHRPALQLWWSGPSEPRLQLHRDAQTLWTVLAKTAMHQCCFPEPYHPPARTSPATRKGVGEDARVRPCSAPKKEGGSLVRGTQESDRTASLAPAQTEIRAGAVLPGSGGTEYQTIGALPQPTDSTPGSRHLERGRRTRPHFTRPQGVAAITEFFNTHA
jgi:hypothetical protein